MEPRLHAFELGRCATNAYVVAPPEGQGDACWIVDPGEDPRPLLSYDPSAASIYGTTPYLQDNSFLIIGERLNASGSKKVRELLEIGRAHV